MAEAIQLGRPVMFGGEEVKEVTLDLEALSGNDMIVAERQFLRSGNGNEGVILKELSKEYQTIVAARASKMPVEFFQQLAVKDFSRVTLRVQRFFLESEMGEK